MKKQGNYELQEKQKVMHERKNYYSSQHSSTGTSNYIVLIMRILCSEQTKIAIKLYWEAGMGVCVWWGQESESNKILTFHNEKLTGNF